MRGLSIVLLWCACGLTTGCAMLADAASPRGARDDVNDPDSYHDEWDTVRKEGRGGEPTEREWDGLTKYTQSSKARAIERNLGYGY